MAGRKPLPHPSIKLSIRVDADTYGKLAARKKVTGKTVSKQIQEAIQVYLIVESGMDIRKRN